MGVVWEFVLGGSLKFASLNGKLNVSICAPPRRLIFKLKAAPSANAAPPSLYNFAPNYP